MRFAHSGVSDLSCSPDTVHVLRAESALGSQEVQDDLTLFNNLGEKHRQAGRQTAGQRGQVASLHNLFSTLLTSMCKFGPNMCSTTLLLISQSASSLAIDLQGSELGGVMKTSGSDKSFQRSTAWVGQLTHVSVSDTSDSLLQTSLKVWSWF